MDIVEEKGALPFDAYRKFLEMIKGSDGKVYEYLGELRILVDDEKTYEMLVSKAERPDGFDRQSWEESANGFRFSRLVDIDSFYSELKFLTDRAIKEGTIIFGGCGNGDVMEWLKRNTNAKIIGLDYSKNMLNECKTKYRADIVLGDCKDIPIRSESIDQVFLAGILPGRNLEILKESKRVLVPGGEVIADMLNFKGYSPTNYKGYNETTRSFMDEKNLQVMQNNIHDDMINLDCIDSVRNLIMSMVDTGLEPKYEFSSLPIIPRAWSCFYEVKVPIAVIGKKPLSKGLN